VDGQKGRVYLPLEDLARYGVSEQQIAERRFDSKFRELMKFEVQRAREWFDRGLPLAKMVDRELALDLELFSRGGLAILDAVEKQDYNVLAQRPVVSKGKKMMLLLRALAGKVKP
jgi:phytoene/squalene synthetase